MRPRSPRGVVQNSRKGYDFICSFTEQMLVEHILSAEVLNNSGQSKIVTLKEYVLFRTSLVVQWLRLHLPVQGSMVQSLIRELRSHMTWGQKAKT